MKLTDQRRSYNMSRIRNKDTKPEKYVRSIIYSEGYRYRLHSSKVIGKPDIIFQKRKKVIFIHGCFWHRHRNCKYCTNPRTNSEFWDKKFINNKLRDKKVQKEITDMGWEYLIIWECETKKDKNLIKKIIKFLGPLKSGQGNKIA